jgi:hypothetical protein
MPLTIIIWLTTNIPQVSIAKMFKGIMIIPKEYSNIP